jgi:hypothetical protein
MFIVPIAQVKHQANATDLEAKALAQLAAAQAKLQGKIAWSDWKMLRDEGRRFCCEHSSNSQA